MDCLNNECDMYSECVDMEFDRATCEAYKPLIAQKEPVAEVPCCDLVMADLRPMKEAPRDGTEILAYDTSGKNFHPIYWKASRISWGMRWNHDYYTTDNFYRGWIPYPEVKP